MGKPLYTPPPGYYDLPFTWVYDASGLTDGNTYLNQFIYLLGGYGDFLLRRIVGLNRFLDPNGGQYQIQDASGNYIQSDRTFAKNADDSMIAPEVKYPELGNIRFDLIKILKPAAPLTAQLAFMGSRRMRGTALARGPEHPKTFTYIMQAVLTQLAAVATPVSVFRQVNDYDFSLYDVILLRASGGTHGTFTVQDEVLNGITFTAVPAGPNSITIQEVDPTPIPNVPLSITVIGNAVTITPATNGGGAVSSTINQIIAAIAASPAASALLTATLINSGGVTAGFVFPPQSLSGSMGGVQPIQAPACKIQIYDRNRVTISNQPVLDIFYNDGFASDYNNGAIVPPLFFPKESQIQIDFTSEETNAGNLPLTIIAILVGRQHFPC